MKIQVGLNKFEIPSVKKLSKLEMNWGLMFSQREKARALLFEEQNIKIHSLFVFYPFLAVWLNNQNKVIEIKKVLPFTLFVSSEKFSSKLLEIPLNNFYYDRVKYLVGKRFK